MSSLHFNLTLKNPQDPADAIPKGTLLAICTTCVTYLIYPVFIGASVLRDASGTFLPAHLSCSFYEFSHKMHITANFRDSIRLVFKNCFQVYKQSRLKRREVFHFQYFAVLCLFSNMEEYCY